MLMLLLTTLVRRARFYSLDLRLYSAEAIMRYQESDQVRLPSITYDANTEHSGRCYFVVEHDHDAVTGGRRTGCAGME